MKPSLQVRLSQHLALTPQLQQSIRLLQLSTLELHQEVQQMLEENPFLEAEDDDEGAGFDLAAQRAARDERAEGEGGGEGGGEGDGDAPREIEAGEFGTTEREDWANGTEGDDFDGIAEAPSGVAAAESEAGDTLDSRAELTSLAAHLRQQATGLRLEGEELAALEVLIESLDGDGYLADPLEEIAERLAAMFGLPPADVDAREALLDRLRIALRFLQSFEPSGVGARSLGECLALQLRQRPAGEARRLALVIAEQHLELLARRDTRRLKACTGADEDLLRDAQALILGCEPKPGRPFVDAESNVIVPDVIVKRAGRGFKVMLNPEVMPKLRINELYARAMRGQRSGHDLGGRLQEARWFVKNIVQRFDTILRVSQAIVERQRNFFVHGDIGMKPLVLREIADELGLHESTISRVTTAKYMATPQGTFELKHFFGSSLATEAGGNASSTAVRALLQQLVDAEDPSQPLSDNQLAQMLEEQGIQVARRTVAKYRDALKIPPANLRKAL